MLKIITITIIIRVILEIKKINSKFIEIKAKSRSKLMKGLQTLGSPN